MVLKKCVRYTTGIRMQNEGGRPGKTYGYRHLLQRCYRVTRMMTHNTHPRANLRGDSLSLESEKAKTPSDASNAEETSCSDISRPIIFIVCAPVQPSCVNIIDVYIYEFGGTSAAV